MVMPLISLDVGISKKTNCYRGDEDRLADNWEQGKQSVYDWERMGAEEARG